MLFTKQTQNSCNWRSQVVSISKLISQACSLELMHKGLFTQWKWRLWQPRCTGTLGSNGTWYLGHCPTAGTAEVWLEGLRGSAAPEGQVPPGLQVTYLLILFNFFFHLAWFPESNFKVVFWIQQGIDTLSSYQWEHAHHGHAVKAVLMYATTILILPSYLVLLQIEKQLG